MIRFEGHQTPVPTCMTTMIDKVVVCSGSLPPYEAVEARLKPGPLELLRNPTRHLFFTGRGGVGKTSLSTAVALQLADTGKRVLLRPCT